MMLTQATSQVDAPSEEEWNNMMSGAIQVEVMQERARCKDSQLVYRLCCDLRLPDARV